MKMVDLFCGIGGIRLGFSQVMNIDCVYSCDIDPYCNKTYLYNFGDMSSLDIRNATKLGAYDILVAGFPCQPWSRAGQQLGFNDPRGTLFYEVLRLLDEGKPEWFLLENVKGLRNRSEFTDIILALFSLGYNVSYKVIDSCLLVPQHRERLYIIGSRNHVFKFPVINDDKPKLGDILDPNPDLKYTISDKLWKGTLDRADKNKNRGNGFKYGLFGPDDISRTLTHRYGKDGAEILIKTNGNPRKLTPRECARLMGFPDSFIIPVSDTQAYRQFGNSVAVPIINKLAEQILAIDNGYIV
jgi:DNA (cytosine-5)-methyltransferase 1